MGSGMTSQDLFLAMVLLRDSVAFYYFDCSMVVPVETERTTNYVFVIVP